MKSFKRIKGILVFSLVFALVSPVVLPVFNVNTATVSAQAKVTKEKTKLNKTKLKLKVGKTYTLKMIANKKKVIWSSGDAAIATVSKIGKVKGVKEGTVTITAVCNKKKYTCKVTVISNKPADTNAVTGSAITNKTATGSAITKKPKKKK